MKDNRFHRARSVDRTRINLNEPHEVRYWTEALDVDEEFLRATVAEFGNKVKDVREAIEQFKAMQRAGPKPPRRATPLR